jgi:hypothetical protein
MKSTASRPYFVSTVYRTHLKTKYKAYLAVSTERERVIPGTIKLINSHQGLNWDMPCLSFIDNKGIEQVKSFTQGTSGYKYSLIGLFDDMTEEQCQEIAELNPNTLNKSFYGNGKREFRTAKKALESFGFKNHVILEYNAKKPVNSNEEDALEVVAKFMGAKRFYYVDGGYISKKEWYVSGVWIFPENPRRREYFLNYNKDWNWLMPVFNKIKKDFKKNMYIPKDINKAFEKVSRFLIDSKNQS